ncbi:hypothetical protein ACIRJS_04710 [Streptomyces sp. NPDC102340]|uniref:hypothetical protein n=1 Tax=unclassified Streptomyces TaxID=2593676 RepID=UPI002E2718BC
MLPALPLRVVVLRELGGLLLAQMGPREPRMREHGSVRFEAHLAIRVHRLDPTNEQWGEPVACMCPAVTRGVKEYGGIAGPELRLLFRGGLHEVGGFSRKCGAPVVVQFVPESLA